MAFVLFAYVFFATYGRFHFNSRPWDLPGGRPADAYYASLAEGFLRGQLSMAHEPHPSLTELPNPYDEAARKANNTHYLWDASYLNGKYYLYFTPLPALLYYVPFRVVYGAYPSDQFAAALFAAWGFIAAALFVRRALRLTGQSPQIPLPIWIVFLGLGNVVAFIMVFSRTYEVAALCAMALSATWAWSLLRYLESATTSRLLWMTTWLALTIAARPNLGVLLPVAVVAIVSATERRDLLKKLVVAAVPLAIVAVSLLSYNYARFHDPLQFGHRYQLTEVNMANHSVCGVCSGPELLRFVGNLTLYLSAPPAFGSEFPFADLPVQYLVVEASYKQWSEEIGGIGPLAPLAIVGSLVALILALHRGPHDLGTRAGILTVAAGWLALAGVSACWFVTARYSLDFMLLMTAGAIVCIERALVLLRNAGIRTLPLRILTTFLACYSIVLGILIAFKGTNDEFGKSNEELFLRLSALF